MNLPNFINFDAFNRLRQRMGTNGLGRFEPRVELDAVSLPELRTRQPVRRADTVINTGGARSLAEKATHAAQCLLRDSDNAETREARAAAREEATGGAKAPLRRPGGDKRKGGKRPETSDSSAAAAARLAARAAARARKGR